MSTFTEDTCVTLLPTFKVQDGKMEEFKAGFGGFVELVKKNEQDSCLHYAFAVSGDYVQCREGYTNAEGLLKHLGNVKEVLDFALTIADITNLQVHGPPSELAKLKEPLAALNPMYYELAPGGLRK